MRSQLLFATVVSASALIQERQDGACQSAILGAQSLVADIPPPPTDAAFQSFLAQQTQIVGQTDACAIPAVTGAPQQVSAYNNWVSSMTSWLGEHGAQVQSIVSVCANDPVFSQLIDGLDLPIDAATICSSYTFATPTGDAGETTAAASESGAQPTASSGGSGTNGTATTGGSSSETSGGAAASSTEAPGAAARQTGMAVAAVAMAGFAALL